MGNILDILDQVNPSESRMHTYDVLQRLKTGGTTTSAESYDYDLVGNRTTSFLSSSHNHDDLNRLTEDDSFTYTYDNNGNLKTKTDKANPTDVTTYHWDAQDQLVQIDRPDSTTVTYKHDGLGRRIEKNVAGTITRYVYDGTDILLEYDGTNTFLARYSHGDQVDQPLILQKTGVGFFYYHSNHQGSITHLTDNSGAVANSYVYDSYGRQLSVAETVIQPYSYKGWEFDVESELYFYRARYYDANVGRFLSEDPIRFRAGDQNLYRYVGNNPINLFDSSGFVKADNRGIKPTAGDSLGDKLLEIEQEMKRNEFETDPAKKSENAKALRKKLKEVQDAIKKEAAGKRKEALKGFAKVLSRTIKNACKIGGFALGMLLEMADPASADAPTNVPQSSDLQGSTSQ